MSDRLSRIRRRGATVACAVIGVFLISSGFSLTTSAYATKPAPDHKVNVCHATSSDTNPYVFINVDIASTKFEGHLMHRNDPNKVWKSDGWWNGTWHTAGSAKRDFIATYTYNGVTHDLDGDITPGFCSAPVTGPITIGDPSFTDPGCPPAPAVGSYTQPAHATWTVASGDTTPGDSITLHGVTDPGYEFSDHSTAKDFSHDYPAIPAQCGGGEETPLDATATPTVVQPSCDNEGVGSLSVSGDHITLSPSSPQTGGSGAHLEITATAVSGHLFADESSHKTFTADLDAFDPATCGEAQTATPRDPTFVDPTCAAQDGSDVQFPAEQSVVLERRAAGAIVKQGTVNGVVYTVTGAMAPGGSVDVDATAAPGFVLAAGARTHWSHTFTDIVAPGTTHGANTIVCGTVVEPPVVKPPVTHPPATNPPAVTPPQSIPTVVHAGLGSLPNPTAASQDLGLGRTLIATGALLLALSGWLALGRRPRRATI